MEPEVRDFLDTLRTQTLAAMQQDLSRAASLPELLALTQASLQHTARTIDAVREQAAVPVACGAGCSWCCHFRIDATAQEVLLIARYIRVHWTPEETAALLAAARARREVELPLHYAARQRRLQPCVLLRDGLCRVYPVRPGACRRYFSGSAEACRSLTENPDAEEAVEIPLLSDTGRALGAGIRRAFLAAGYDHYFYDLNAALVEALEDEACEHRWAAKEPAFSPEARTLMPPPGPPGPLPAED